MIMFNIKRSDNINRNFSKKIYLNIKMFNAFVLNFYDNHTTSFEYLYRKPNSFCIVDIENIDLFIEWKKVIYASC